MVSFKIFSNVAYIHNANDVGFSDREFMFVKELWVEWGLMNSIKLKHYFLLVFFGHHDTHPN